MSKIILFGNWTDIRKLSRMFTVPDKYYIISRKYTNYKQCFAICDAKDVAAIYPGDGDMCVHNNNQNVKKHIICESIEFENECDDNLSIIERIKSKYVDCDEIKEVDALTLKKELSERTTKIKNGIKSTVKEMLNSKKLVPQDTLSMEIKYDEDNGNYIQDDFESTEEEILALGSFVYRGLSGIQEYIIKKLGIDVNSVKAFSVPDYEYPLIALCFKGDDPDFIPSKNRFIRSTMEMLSCYLPSIDNSLYYNISDIEFTNDDVEMEFNEPEKVRVFLYQYRPSAANMDEDKKNIDFIIDKGLVPINYENGDITFLNGARTIAGQKFLKLVSKYVECKYDFPIQKDLYTVGAITDTVKELLYKVTQHSYIYSREFFYHNY